MPNINRIELAGHLGKQPETKKIKETDFASFSIATSEKFKDKETTDWHYIECWGIWAKLAATLKKGDAVYVEGKSKSRTYDKDGKKQTFHFVRADMFFKIEHIDLKEPKPVESEPIIPQTAPDDLAF